MKIIHVEDYFDPTAGYQINELLKVKSTDEEVYLISSYDMTPFHKNYDIEQDRIFEARYGVKIIRLEAKFKVASRMWIRGLNKKIKEINPDLVYMHGIGDFKDLQLWLPKKKYKIVRDCHMSWVASKNRFAKLYYKFYKLFFASLINSTDKYTKVFALGVEEQEYLKALGIKDQKIDYLYHGYNDEIMYYDENERKDIRKYYGFEENDIVISYIGKFDFAKQPDLIIDIVNKLDEEVLKNKSIKLLFIGAKNDEYMKIFNEKLTTLNSKIKYYIDESKPFEELRKYFSASDICIFPKETTLSSIHAQICGCDVIMEKHKSNIERVIKKENLFVINNIIDAKKILIRIIKNREFLKNKNVVNSYVLSSREYKKQTKKIKEII